MSMQQTAHQNYPQRSERHTGRMVVKSTRGMATPLDCRLDNQGAQQSGICHPMSKDLMRLETAL